MALFDHLALSVADLGRSTRQFGQVMEALGIRIELMFNRPKSDDR